MKKIFKKRNVLITIILILLIIFLFPIKMYTYEDHTIPGNKYKIKLNTITKELKGEFHHYCSFEDCETSIYKYSITLTKDEYKKIMKLWNDKEMLSSILETLCENDKIFYNSFEDSREENLEDYNKLDLNSDGKITSREFGNRWLDYAISEE